jgi:CheY-like chemotaxis protein
VAHILSPQASRKGLQIQRRVEDAVPVLVSGDPVRLQQVLLNLAGNAVKFTEKGRIDLEVRCAGGDAKRATLKFAVRDSGIGISAAEMPRLFESFSQVDASVTRRFGGTGLGLAISKRLTELMGGTIGVESQPGKGSTFWFTAEFPVCPPGTLPAGAPAPAEAGAPLAPVANLRILVAEDNDVNQIVIRTLLEKLGCRAEIVDTGRAAVQAASAGAFDVVLMDMQMPDMDGYTAMGTIRTIERPSERRTPIVALTAHALKGDREKCLMAGADEYLSKPVRLKELAAVLSRIRPGAAAPPAPVERG